MMLGLSCLTLFYIICMEAIRRDSETSYITMDRGCWLSIWQYNLKEEKIEWFHTRRTSFVVLD